MKLSDKLAYGDESFSVYRYDNGFMIEVSGQDSEENWKTAKIMATTEDELVELVREALSLPTNS